MALFTRRTERAGMDVVVAAAAGVGHLRQRDIMAFFAGHFFMAAGQRKSAARVIERGDGRLFGERAVAALMVAVALDAGPRLFRAVKTAAFLDAGGDRFVAIQTLFIGDTFE